MTKQDHQYMASMAELAARRADFYAFFAGGWNQLPEASYLDKLKGAELDHMLNACCNYGSKGFIKGSNCIRSYLAGDHGKSDAQMVEELSVDRTRILRGTGHKDMMPPYEGLYKGKKNTNHSILALKRFYRRTGLALEDSVNEAPDFICVQLDFMKQIILREKQQWLSEDDVGLIITQEETFLKNHLGSWVSDFCFQVNQHAQTNYYRGIAMIMDDFIVADMSYLEGLSSSLR